MTSAYQKESLHCIWNRVKTTAFKAHNTGKNLNTCISVFLIHETEIPVVIPVLQKQTFSQ